MNVALYGTPSRWAMTERGRASLRRDATHLAIGPSALEWDGAALTIRVDEWTAPIPSRLRGTIRVTPSALTSHGVRLDDEGRHRWSPIAPSCRVEVAMERPSLRWSGPGYLDSNEGDGPLERDFVEWDWLRAPTEDGALILYNATRRRVGHQSLSLAIDRAGAVRPLPALPLTSLPRTFWRMRPTTRCDPGSTPSVHHRLEDAPFYNRSVIDTSLNGRRVRAVHEHLSLDRFASPIVQAMLPFRMPRWG